ncbi:hypothetical protein BZL30_1050 [Mycobacterium kansasii]|uniref:Aldehyde dehydrogenase family protein n=1 Tax=Mycobacterium kansasii TaxID=1768 RepID=A0A1V3XRY7_MYCKA|nr:hypothetical protein BZL30_1050 [Mycobacterium kansasii]
MATDIKHYQMFINGKHVDSDEMDQIRDPATEEVYATIARARPRTPTPPWLRRARHSSQAHGRDWLQPSDRGC